MRWLVVLVALVGCRGGSSTKTKRTGSAAPVEMITQPQLPDGGAGAGPNVDEIEPNDGEDVATPVALGGIARGKLDPETDADYYRLDIEQVGVLQVALSGVDGVDLSLELIDGTGASLGKSDRTGVRVKEGIPNAGVTPGRYTLVVRQAPKKKVKPPKAKKGAPVVEVAPAAPVAAPVYELTAQLVPLPAGAEREPDDDRGTANDLIVLDNASGYLGWTGDKDVWKLSVETLSDKNALDIEVSAIEGVALELEVTDGVGLVLASRKAPRGQPMLMQNLLPVVPDGAPPFYYLTIKGDRSNPETAYTLHATAQVLVGPDPELEPNDNADKPQQIQPERKAVHASWTPGDVDCFALAPSDKPRTVDVSIDTPSDLDLAGELLVDGKSVATANKGGKGVLEKLSGAVPAGAKAVIRIKNPDANASAGAKYDVTVDESDATGDNAP